MKRILLFNIAVMAFLTVAHAESRNEAKAREREESEKPRQVNGGVLLTIPKNYDVVYEAVLNSLKKKGETIDAASKETGQITTAITVKGGWRQTGTRSVVALIKEKEGVTTIRAVVTEQKRYKALQTEPWSDPVVDPKASAVLREELQSLLQ